MTYATVASLLQTLDNLLKFTRLIFKALELQGHSLITISQYVPVVSSSCLKMYEEAQGVLLELKEIQVGEIQRVLQHLFSPSSSRLPQLTDDDANAATCRQFVEECILLNQTFMENITVSCDIHKEITDLYLVLRFLLTNLDNFPKTSDFLLKRIKGVTDRARDMVEESIEHAELEPMNRLLMRVLPIYNPELLQQIPFSSSTSDNGIDRAVLRFNQRVKNAIFNVYETLHHPSFDGSRGIRRSLLRAFKEIEVLITDITRNMKDEKISLKSSSISPRDSKQETLVAFDDEQLILERLTRLPSGLEIVTIVAMGGIGKTTLAKKLYNHPYTCYHFDCRAWVTISQVYQFRDLLLDLLSANVGRSDKMMEKSNGQLAEDLYRSLKGKRYLIVMDDMWSIDAWNDLKRCFPDDKKIGSRIIVTSRLTELANYVNPNKPPHFMNLLDTKRCWELLEKLVFGIASCSPELVEVGKEIAKRCRGLPLAIVVIAGILCSTIRTLDSWKHIANNLSSIVSTDPEQCLDVLSLSYIYLPII